MLKIWKQISVLVIFSTLDKDHTEINENLVMFTIEDDVIISSIIIIFSLFLRIV